MTEYERFHRNYQREEEFLAEYRMSQAERPRTSSVCGNRMTPVTIAFVTTKITSVRRASFTRWYSAAPPYITTSVTTPFRRHRLRLNPRTVWSRSELHKVQTAG